MPLTAGQMLQNRYRAAAQLGQGGMGAVYRAWDTRLNVTVAVKEMVPQPGIDEQTLAELREQFRQEATVVARLQHPHLVRVTDFFQESGNAYLVMDFVEGESLAEKITREGALGEAQVVAWAVQLLDALTYCHDQGIIHRDIKPQNVIIRTDSRAVLVDFGLVKLWDPTAPQTRTVMRGMGTPEYAPPEQYDVSSGHTDARSDLYSLGATLFHALTGQLPPTATRRIADRSSFQAPRVLQRMLSNKINQVVLTAMELTVEYRYPSAAAMAQALQAKSASPPRPAPPAYPVGRTMPAPEAYPVGRTVPVPNGGVPPYAGAPSGYPAAPQYPATPPPQMRPAAQQKGRNLGWLWALLGALMAVLFIAAGLVLAGSQGIGPLEALFAEPTPTLMAVAEEPPATSTSAPTETASPAPSPTATPVPTDTPPPTSTPRSNPTEGPTPTATPEPTATPQPTAEVTPQPTSPPPPTAQPGPPAAPSTVFNFEQDLNWQRGDEPYGTFVRSGEQIHSGGSAGKLAYNFPAEKVNYVVFRVSPASALSGQPSGLTAWVYGDGAGHFLNAWIQDSAGETRQYTFGRVSHTGWQQMTAFFSEDRGWPNVHIGGADNGRLDYPARFQAFVFDGVPDEVASAGTIYIDDVLTIYASLPAATPVPQPGTSSSYLPAAPAAGQVAGAGGIIGLGFLLGAVVVAGDLRREEDSQV